MGRVKTKHLDPTYTAGGNAELESLNYSFNIHNQITGINKDYAKKTSGTYNKWGHFFGMYLGFDKTDGFFTRAELNGQVTGVLWNTQGDDAQRMYNYRYDNAGRLINAAFTEQQHPGDGFSNAKMDFSVTGTSGQITYDLNGNLLTMLQRGVQPGAAAPIAIDDLRYSYAAQSNKLQSVTDAMTATTQNGLSGDFKDGSNGSNPDYVYDNNGNVVIDLNKNAKDLNGVAGANGIHYNFLDKPDQIRIAGKGTIAITYSADGDKLQRTFTPETAGITVTTSYISQFVYRKTSSGGGDSLQYMSFEEGRVRVMQAVSQGDANNALMEDGNIDLPGGRRGAWDYFVMDYQQNVRMILTEETHTAYSTATMETAQQTYEDGVFGQPGAGNEVEATRVAKPAGWTNAAAGASVCRLGNTFGKTLGPNTLQKVMAGDALSATVLYYCPAATTGSPNNTLANTIVSNLLGVLMSGGGGATGAVKGNAGAVTTQLGGNGAFTGYVQPSNTTGTIPQAYLTILFFDERFNFISASDGGAASLQITGTTGASGSSLTLANVKAPKNGYAYAYVSNRSNADVYFDNFKVQVAAGNIIEENHYYAYGLKIASISSVKLGDEAEGGLQNNYQYQGAYSELDADIGWNDFALRNYDAQIGRWVQQDPYQQYASPYVGMGNDPVNFTDPSGGGVLGLTPGLFTVMTTSVGFVLGGDISAATGGSFWKGAAIGAAVGFAAGYIPSLIGGGVGQSVSHAISIINVSVKAVGITKDIVQAGDMNKSISRWSSGYMTESNRVHGPMVDFDNFDDGGGGDDPPLKLQNLSNWEREQYEKAADWSHHDKQFGGRHDLKKDKEGNIYEQDKDSKGEAQPTGWKIKNGVITSVNNVTGTSQFIKPQEVKPVQDNLIPPKYINPNIKPLKPGIKPPVKPVVKPPVIPVVPDVNPTVPNGIKIPELMPEFSPEFFPI